MAAEPAPDPAAVRAVPRYAWDWLQRSRPIVERLAEVLTGQPPKPGFVDAVRRSFAEDQLVRDAVHSVIAEIAFRGRVPGVRPPGVSWDRGLVWWASSLAGRPPEAFAAEPTHVDQPPLFGDTARSVAAERRAVISALQDLLAQSTGDQVPASAIRQLIAHLEHDSQRADGHR